MEADMAADLDGQAAAAAERAAASEAPPPPPSPEVRAEKIQLFDPRRYLTKVGTADYLEVKWRLVWFEDVVPDGSITTEMLESPRDDEAIFKATVTFPGGKTVTAHGSEHYGDFKDFREKAETKAIGRALAIAGFGSQFVAYEFDSRIVDSPVQHSPNVGGGQRGGGNNRGGTSAPRQNASQRPAQPQNGGTAKPKTAIHEVYLIGDLKLVPEEQAKRWGEATAEAERMLMGGNPQEVQVAWKSLAKWAETACKKGGIAEDTKLPLQRWRFYPLMAGAPTSNFLNHLATLAEELGAWDDALVDLHALRDAHLKGGGDTRVRTDDPVLDDLAATAAKVMSGEPPDIPF